MNVTVLPDKVIDLKTTGALRKYLDRTIRHRLFVFAVSMVLGSGGPENVSTICVDAETPVSLL
jgi:hypothetical protein